MFWTVCEGLCPLMTQLTLESLNQPSRLRTMIAIMIIHICYTNQNMITMIRWRDLYVKSKWLLCCSMNTVFFPTSVFFGQARCAFTLTNHVLPKRGLRIFCFFTGGSAKWFTVHSRQLQTLTWASNIFGGTSEISLASLLRLSTSPWGIRWWWRECGRISNSLHKSWDVSEMLSLL